MCVCVPTPGRPHARAGLCGGAGCVWRMSPRQGRTVPAVPSGPEPDQIPGFQVLSLCGAQWHDSIVCPHTPHPAKLGEPGPRIRSPSCKISKQGQLSPSV